tara:strand:- start:2718 stop:3314 length:597 start_codon:yes stop_codon:yes gene_type:complete
MKEIWKDVVDFEGYYEVSNKGNVRLNKNVLKKRDGRGCSHKVGKNLALRKSSVNIGPHGNKYTYCHIILRNGKKQKDEYIHRMVAKAFIPNPNNKPFVDHVNGDRSNNCVENLRWCTRSENGANRKKQNKRKTGQTSSKYKGVQRLKGEDHANKPWKMTLSHQNKLYSQTFKTEKEAAQAYNEKALEIFGEFASLNEI